MKPADLVRECVHILQQQPTIPYIMVIGKIQAKGWPRGACVGSDSRGHIYAYDARRILIRLASLGICRIIETEDRNLRVTVGDEVYDIPMDDAARES